MNSKTRWKMIGSLSALVVFASVSIGTTFALFTSSKTVTNHLTISGGVKASVYLTALSYDSLTDKGLIQSNTVDLSTYSEGYEESKSGVDLSKYKDAIFPDTPIAPTMTGSATFTLYNTGDMAFNYTITPTYSATDASGESLTDLTEIKRQIVFTIADDNTSTTIEKDGHKSVTISYSFIDDKKNNDIASQSISLDLLFDVTQVTKSTK